MGRIGWLTCAAPLDTLRPPRFKEAFMTRRPLLISLRLAAALFLSIVLGIATSSPASAATGWDRCPRGYLCVFEDANGLGHYAYFAGGASNLANPIGGFVFNDKISSVWNNTTQPDGWCFYTNSGFTTPLFLMRGNNKNRTNLISGHNDKVSSLHILYGCPGAYIYG
jgi:hypothetical protein